MGACGRLECEGFDYHYRSHSEVELFEDALAMGSEFHTLIRVLVTDYADEGYKDAMRCFLSAHSKMVRTYDKKYNTESVVAVTVVGACRRLGCQKFDCHYRSHSEVELYEDTLAMGSEFHTLMRVLVTDYKDEGYDDAKSCFLSAHSKLVLTYKDRDNAGRVLGSRY